MRRTTALLLSTLAALMLVAAGATGTVGAQDTVTEYDMSGDFDDITLQEGTTYQLDLQDVGGNLTIYDGSNTSNATVLLSTTETGTYESNENVSWTDNSPDYVQFTVTSSGNFSDDVDGGWYTTDGQAEGTISVSSGLLPAFSGAEAAAVLGVPMMMLVFGVGALLAFVLLLVAVVRIV
jgi:hypothetical protein